MSSLVSALDPQAQTPMIRQYLDIKKQNEAYVLFFRMGDFYEMFFDDALEVSKFLEITLTSRGDKVNRIPMCGIPYHAAENYLAKLIKGGYKVAICEQVEDPKATKGLVKREVVRYYTPGTIVSDSMLEGSQSNYLAAVVIQPKRWGLAFIDLSTGEFKTAEFYEEAELMNELERLAPAEVLYQEGTTLSRSLLNWVERKHVVVSAYDDWAFSLDGSVKMITQFFQTQSLDGFGLRDLPAAIQASGAILNYAKHMQGSDLKHIQNLQRYTTDEYMVLDAATQRNLELVQNLSGDSKYATLLSVLDKTKTSAGGRQLRAWMLQPLRNVLHIQQRLDAVQEFVSDEKVRSRLRVVLKQVHDVERIIARIETAVANARDLVALSESLHMIPQVLEIITPLKSSLMGVISERLQPLDDLTHLMDSSLNEEPPFSVREGGFIRDGFNADLDELRLIKRDGKQWLAKLQEDERAKTGIKTLKVKYNKVFGYHLEVSKGQVSFVPEHYIRKQTMVNAERYITPELKEKEAIILGADDRIAQLEYQIFEDLRHKVSEYTPDLQRIAKALAQLDVLQSLAQVAFEEGYHKPELCEGTDLLIEGGRHPVVEHLLVGERFVPNDTHLSCTKQQLMMITGPNMAGKSTYIRQVALISFMAQMGSFVPATKARLGIVDRIFTRVGAADELARGQSTFMLEMNETANILNNATSQSLIILDEVGRGTSTCDGVSIAWAIAEYIHEVLQAKTIFATHYHELTDLASRYERIVNYNVACQENAKDVVFLHKIVAGGTDKSYGIHVARLAGVPHSILQRAQDILKGFEDQQHTVQAFENVPSVQDVMDLDLPIEDSSSQAQQDVCEELKALDCSQLTPIEALMALDRLASKLKS